MSGSQSRSETTSQLSQPLSRGGGLHDQETGCDNTGQGSLSGGLPRGGGVLPLYMNPYLVQYGFSAPPGPHSSARNESSAAPNLTLSADIGHKIDFLCNVQNISDRLTSVEQRDTQGSGPGVHQVSAPPTVPSEDAMDCDGDYQSIGDDSSLLDTPGDSGEVSDMKRLRALVRQYVPPEFCPLHPEGRSLPSAS